MRILLAEDEDTLRTVITEVLEEDGHAVSGFPSGEEALAEFRRNPFPIVITDIVMGRMTGLQLLSEIKTIEPEAILDKNRRNGCRGCPVPMTLDGRMITAQPGPDSDARTASALAFDASYGPIGACGLVSSMAFPGRP